MALRDKIRDKAAAHLEPGEQIEAVFAGQTHSQYLIVFGAIIFLLLNKYRCVVVTDRRVAVFDAGKLGMSNPRQLIASLPRNTPLGAPSGLWHVVELNGESLRVHKRFHKDITSVQPALAAAA
ncbi:MAG: hypothetical protein ACKV2O_00740 [Acidimicrobiales bacterium]